MSLFFTVLKMDKTLKEHDTPARLNFEYYPSKLSPSSAAALIVLKSKTNESSRTKAVCTSKSMQRGEKESNLLLHLPPD